MKTVLRPIPAPEAGERVLEGNLRVLRRTAPAAAEALEQWARNGPSAGAGVRIIETPSGHPSLELVGGGFLHSRYDPVREAEAWAARIPGSGGV
ncbi:MAG TPA: hypothetical protein VF282_00780, partial [Bacillota bacterium]